MDPSRLSQSTSPPDPEDAAMARARLAMVLTQLVGRDIRDPRVLAAMAAVPRHRFVPAPCRAQVHDDHPLPLGHGQTLSQPYIVAFMTQALHLQGGERVLEVGSGSGYVLAVLARLAGRIHGIEREPLLHDRARATLDALGLQGVQTRCGDGWLGWPEEGPFEGILVSCAPEEVPPPLVAQLAPGGTLVVPVGPGGGVQHLVRLTRTPGGLHQEILLPVAFVPLRRGREP